MSEQGAAEQPTSPDPLELWRQFQEASEQVLARAMQEMRQKPQPPEEAAALEMLLAFQRMMRDALSTQLDNLNLPTRDDMNRLAGLIVNVEEKVGLLAARMTELERALVGRKPRARRRPPVASGVSFRDRRAQNTPDAGRAAL